MNINTIKLLLKLKNAAFYHKEYILIPYNKHYIKYLLAFYKEGCIQSFTIFIDDNNIKQIKIYLRLLYNKMLLKDLKIISKSSLKKYINYKNLSKFSYNVKKTLFLSTNKGIVSTFFCKKYKIGGKLYYLC